MSAIKAKAAHAGLDKLFEPKSAPMGAAGALSEEDKSKDAFFVQVAEIAEAMSAKHGKEFAMGTLVLSARFLAENRPLIKRENGESGHQ